MFSWISFVERHQLRACLQLYEPLHSLDACEKFLATCAVSCMFLGISTYISSSRGACAWCTDHCSWYICCWWFTYEQNDYVEGAHDIEASLQAQCPSTITYWGFVESDRMDKPFAKHKHPNFVLALSTVQSYHMQQPQFHCLDFKGEAITST